jgi:hypothetical protein
MFLFVTSAEDVCPTNSNEAHTYQQNATATYSMRNMRSVSLALRSSRRTKHGAQHSNVHHCVALYMSSEQTLCSSVYAHFTAL